MIGKLIFKQEVAKNVLEVKFFMPDEFVFEAGQYIQLVLAENLKHYFSITNSPNEKNTLRISTRLSESEFKNKLQSLPLGSEVQINGPWGDFVLNKKIRSYFFVAGGIGITPFMSMLRYIREEKLPITIRLFWVNHSADFPPYLEELQSLEKNHSNFELILESRPLLRIPMGQEIGVERELFYIAGPPAFVSQIIHALQAQGIESQNIITDSFTGY